MQAPAKNKTLKPLQSKTRTPSAGSADNMKKTEGASKPPGTRAQVVRSNIKPIPKKASQNQAVNVSKAAAAATKAYGRHARIERTAKNPNLIKSMKLDPWNHNKVLPGIKTMLERFDDMLSGQLDNIPDKPPSEVRIFLSSTFSDMRKERNGLMKHVYPKLKEYCYNDLDLDFQVVDMRWGVTDDATNEHIAERLCLQEIASCQRLSLGPNFVTILGDRYGTRHSPPELSVAEFDILLNEAKELSHPHTALLEEWYCRDDNTVPPCYVLQPIRSKLPHFADFTPENEALRKQHTAQWWDINTKLQEVVRACVDAAHRKGLFTDSQKHHFIMAVTECEIQMGILSAESPAEHTVCFIRHFTDLANEKLQDKGADRHTEVTTKDGMTIVNQETEALREKLHKKRIPSKLPVTHIRKYELPWRPGGVDPNDKTHASYLETFMEEFGSKIMTLIQHAQDKRNNKVIDMEYYTGLDEILHHLHFCRDKCATFQGQRKALGRIKEYLGSPKNRQPMVVHAESGRGKTSLLAMAFKLVPSWFGPSSLRLIRFLGTSPDSTNIYDVLYSIMGQLADLTDQIIEPITYSSMKNITKHLPRFLRNISRTIKQPVYIFLDSIDQLESTDGAYGMKWLPTELPSNINIIISTLPTAHNILENTQRVLGKGACILELPPLPEETGEAIIDAFLSSKKRTLTDDQKHIIISNLRRVPSPLYLKLLLDRAIHWRSYDKMDSVTIADSVRGAITQLFTNLEQKYGETLIGHTLGYITMGMNGLSEVELEDVLSCNDRVLNEVYQYHDPPVEGIIRIPTLLWARIRDDIKEYLVERLSHGKKTIYWYHRQFIEAARERYTGGTKAAALHKDLALIYLAETGLKRDIILTKRKVTIPQADRQVTPQPLLPKNKRKLLALPLHIKGSGDMDLLKKAALCNLNFIRTKIQGISLNALLRDFGDMDPSEMDPELSIVFKCLQELKSLKKVDHLPIELLSRLREDGSLPNVSTLLQDARAFVESSVQGSLLPLYPCLEKSMSPLLATLGGKDFTVMASSADNSMVLVRRTKDDGLCELLILDLHHKQMQTHVVADACIYAHLDSRGTTLYTVTMPSSAPVPVEPGEEGQNVAAELRLVCEERRLDELKRCVSSQIILPSSALNGTCRPSDLVIVARSKTSLAAAFSNDNVIVWDLPTEKPKAKDPWKLANRSGKITKLMFSQNEILVAIFSGNDEPCDTVCMHNRVTNVNSQVDAPGKICTNEKSVSLISLHPNDPEEPTEAHAFLFHVRKENGREVLFVLYDVKGNIQKKEITIGENRARGMCVTQYKGQKAKYRDTVFVITDEELSGYNLITGAQVFAASAQIQDITCLAVEENAEFIYVGQNNGCIQVLTMDMTNLGQFRVHNSVVDSVVFSEAKGVLLCLGDNHSKLMSLSTDLMQDALRSGSGTSTPVGVESVTPTVNMLEDYHQAKTFHFLPEGREAVITGLDGTVTFWNLADRKRTGCIEVGVLDRVILTQSGKYLIGLDTDQLDIKVVATGDKKLSAGFKLPKTVLSFCLNQKEDILYAVTRAAEKVVLHAFMLEDRSEQFKMAIHSIPASSGEVRIKLTASEEYLVFSVRVTQKEAEIIAKSESKQNIPLSNGLYKFFAVSLKTKSSDPIPCYRVLTKIPMLANCWAMQHGHSVLFGLNRKILFWDIDSGTCDQRMLKGTKIPKFFRCIWIESEGNWGTICKGKTLCMETDARSRVLAAGSEDGFVLVYDLDNGKNLGGNLSQKKPQHSTKITHIAVSPNTKLVASVSADRALLVWSLSQDNFKEIFNMRLNIEVTHLCFSEDDLHLAITGSKDFVQNKILLFRVVGLQ